MLYDLISCDFKTSWWFQPIWKMFVKMGENLSQFSGWKFLKKYLSCHPPTKMIPWKGWCCFFLHFFCCFYEKKTAKLSVFPPKNLSRHFPPKTPPMNLASVASPSATWGTWQGVRTISTGGKTMRLHKIFRSSKKDHENSWGRGV